MSLPDCGSCRSVVHSSCYKGDWVIVLVLVQALQKLASTLCMAVVFRHAWKLWGLCQGCSTRPFLVLCASHPAVGGLHPQIMVLNTSYGFSGGGRGCLLVLRHTTSLGKYQSLCDCSDVLSGKVLKGFQESSKTRVGSAMLVVIVHNFWCNCRATTGHNVCGLSMSYSSVLILRGYCGLLV